MAPVDTKLDKKILEAITKAPHPARLSEIELICAHGGAGPLQRQSRVDATVSMCENGVVILCKGLVLERFRTTRIAEMRALRSTVRMMLRKMDVESRVDPRNKIDAPITVENITRVMTEKLARAKLMGYDRKLYKLVNKKIDIEKR